MDISNLVKRGQKGDKKAIEELIITYNPLIQKIVYSYYIHGHDKDDLAQLARIYLIDALKKYDEDKGYNFTVFLNVCLKRRFINLIREHEKENYNRSLNFVTNSEGAEFQHYLEDDFSIEENYIKKEDRLRLKKALETLTKEDREFILNVCLVKGGMKKYSRDTGLSYNSCRSKKDKILFALKATLF